MFGQSLWAFVVIGGFLILAGVIAYAKMNNRTSARTDAMTEAATRQRYHEQSAEDEPRTP